MCFMERLKIVVLDFGSQYAHLIAKRFRMMGYYSEIALPSAGLETFKNAKGIVLSGGPSSIYDKNAPEFNSEILKLDIPILGLCYGHYVLQTGYNGKAQKALVGEFGFATLELNQNVKCPLFEEIASPQQVWMSHQDAVVKPGDGFETVGSTKDCEFAALQNLEKKRFSLQFHCEVKDTPCGNKILENFAKFCGMEKNWDQDTVLNHIIDSIKNQADDKNVLLFLSGGVDSTVAFALLNKALGQERVLGLHIDNGFMRKNESKKVEEAYKNHGFSNFIVEDASKTFLKAVENLTDPQKKRMAIGENFITVRNEVVAKQKFDENKWLLAQGTLYPDIIESGGTKNSNVIKTHHNRVDGIQKLIEKGLIIEPLKDLYKDEVQKGNAPEERKLQRLFRNPKVSKLIKKCNDFGAGGVSVAIGELSDGIDINLNAILKKYEGLDGTELAISESQERMAVVIDKKDIEKFLSFAKEENLQAVKVATIKKESKLTMFWNGKKIVDISREFLNSNGAKKHINAKVKSFKNFDKKIPKDFVKGYKSLLSDINVCSKRGLSERFDSTIGAGTVLMPFGGKFQLTPIQAMVQKISVEKKETNNCSLMSYGFNPFIIEKSPYHGAYFSVIESVCKLIATGSDVKEIYLTFQEYFEKLGKDKNRWGWIY